MWIFYVEDMRKGCCFMLLQVIILIPLDCINLDILSSNKNIFSFLAFGFISFGFFITKFHPDMILQ
jgi:hypothetical protein